MNSKVSNCKTGVKKSVILLGSEPLHAKISLVSCKILWNYVKHFEKDWEMFIITKRTYQKILPDNQHLLGGEKNLMMIKKFGVSLIKDK